MGTLFKSIKLIDAAYTEDMIVHSVVHTSTLGIPNSIMWMEMKSKR